MSERNAGVSRRGFLQATAGGATVTAASGAAAAQENQTQGNETGGNQTGGNQTGGNQTGGNQTGGNETEGNQTAGNESEGGGGGGGGGGGTPDFGGYLDDANNYDGSVVDETGSSEVTVEVGAGDGLAFGPAAVHVDNGATVVWEWTGEGGAHNVVHEDGEFESGPPEGGSDITFEYTFDEDGVYNYYCQPHRGAGMLGSVVVGTDYPSTGGGDGGGSGGGPTFPESALSIGVATSFVMSATLGLAYFFMKYGGDYETPS